MKNVFKTKLSTASLVLIPACIGINYLGKLFASVLKLPLWLDSIGTCIGGALGGPIIGAICGAANNLIYGFTTLLGRYYRKCMGRCSIRSNSGFQYAGSLRFLPG